MMINVSLLKKQILGLAFSGKLTEHKSNESSNDLIDKLFKNKQKKYASFSHELANFEIPPNWNWCMTYQAVSLDNGTESEGELLPYLEVKYLRNGKEPKIINSGVIVDKGEKLILVDGENSGEVFLANDRGYKGSTLKILNISNAFIDKYIFLFIYSCKEGFRKNKTGAAIPHLDKKMLFETPLPIPPLEEQKRIVAKLDEIFAELDKIDEKQITLETIQEKMEAKILKLAIQGKIVKQKPEEGTGEGLFKLIQEEKQKLIKQGVIKKEKPLPAIEEDEVSFKIPSSWKWCKFGQLISLTSGIDLEPKDYFSESNSSAIPYITGASCVDENGKLVINRFTDKSHANSTIGDILLTCKGTIGKIAVNDKGNMHLARQLMGIKTLIDFNFTRYYLMFIVDELKTKANGLIPGIDRPTVLNYHLPLPPLDEQRRIVAKIEELLPLCRTI